MDLELFKAMYEYLWEFIYKVLAIFGIEKDENGNLIEK